MNITLIGDFVPGSSDVFQLFENGSVAGSFAQLNLPTLVGLEWDTTALYTEGKLSLTAVPEPTTCALIFGALAILHTIRSRKMLFKN